MRNYRARTPNQKVEHNAYMRAYRAKPKTNIEFSISKFHEMIAEGPLYICSCCDYLWYKHAILNAEKLRESNRGIGEYLKKRKVLLMQNGFVEHAIVIWLRIKTHRVLLLMAWYFHKSQLSLIYMN